MANIHISDTYTILTRIQVCESSWKNGNMIFFIVHVIHIKNEQKLRMFTQTLVNLKEWYE